MSDSTMNIEVTDAFAAYPPEMSAKLLVLRQLIYDTAALIDEVGALEETLKWGEPSYLTPASKSGSTIRLAWKAAKPDQYAIFFKCTANLVPAFRKKHPHRFNYEGNRSISFTPSDDVPITELTQCIALALTYHRNKKLEPNARWEFVEKALAA